MKYCTKCGEKIKKEEEMSLAEPIFVLIFVTLMYIISLFTQV